MVFLNQLSLIRIRTAAASPLSIDVWHHIDSLLVSSPLGRCAGRQVACVAQRMGQWEPIIDHTHPPIYTSDTSTCTHPPLYTREVTVLIAGGCRWVPSPSNPPHTASPPLMSRQTTAESKAANGNTEIKTAANVFSDILFPTD